MLQLLKFLAHKFGIGLDHHHGVLENGENITPELFLKVLPEELDKIKIELANSPIKGQYDKAAEIFKELTLSEDFVDFLTLPAYEEIS